MTAHLQAVDTQRKRFFFKLEIEQLPDAIWAEFIANSPLLNTTGQDKSEFLSLIESLPNPALESLIQTLKKIRANTIRQALAQSSDSSTEAFLSESAFSNDWLSANEDAAWQDL